MTTPTILFLDFDGVLHPAGGAAADERFSRLPLLEALLREPEFQQVAVVIASTWREAYSLTSLARYFAEDIRPRIIGVTPTLEDDNDDEFLRYREIRAWLNHHPEVQRWAVLDDAVDEFPPGKRASVVFTRPLVGLQGDGIEALRRLLGRDG